MEENRLKGARIARGMTQKKLAELLGIPTTTLSGYENTSRKMSAELLNHVSLILDVSMDYLLGNTDFLDRREARKDKFSEYENYFGDFARQLLQIGADKFSVGILGREQGKVFTEYKGKRIYFTNEQIKTLSSSANAFFKYQLEEFMLNNPDQVEPIEPEET